QEIAHVLAPVGEVQRHGPDPDQGGTEEGVDPLRERSGEQRQRVARLETAGQQRDGRADRTLPGIGEGDAVVVDPQERLVPERFRLPVEQTSEGEPARRSPLVAHLAPCRSVSGSGVSSVPVKARIAPRTARAWAWTVMSAPSIATPNVVAASAPRAWMASLDAISPPFTPKRMISAKSSSNSLSWPITRSSS